MQSGSCVRVGHCTSQGSPEGKNNMYYIREFIRVTYTLGTELSNKDCLHTEEAETWSSSGQEPAFLSSPDLSPKGRRVPRELLVKITWEGLKKLSFNASNISRIDTEQQETKAGKQEALPFLGLLHI